LYVSGEGFRKLDYTLSSIFVAPNCLFGIDNNHVASNLNSGAELFHSEYAVCFAASSTIRAIIPRNRQCIAAFPTVTKTVTDGAIAIGCTSSAVYAATAESLVECRVDASRALAVPEPMVAMLCSDDDGYFIGKSGKLYKGFEESFVPINGLPPVVKVSVGIQHCAAIAADGRVFVWGFNPSGQLGFGSDRAVQVPICVLEGAQQVACGVHNTWVLIALR
jgi:hypothetical protein